MGMEILGADITRKQIEANEGKANFSTEMDCKSLSNIGQELDEPTKTGSMESSNEISGKAKEADNLVSSNIPKDAVDEWPAPMKIRTFYFARVRLYEDPELKDKIEKAEKRVETLSKDRAEIIDKKLKPKRSERSELISGLRPFREEKRKYSTTIDEKMKEIKPLRSDLQGHRDVRERSMGLCSSEEELNDLIRSLHYRIQHESNTLNEEKQLLKEIKQLEATREKIIANVALKAAIEKEKGSKAELQDRIKLLGVNMDEIRKGKQVVEAEISQLDKKLKVVDDEIASLERELKSATERKDRAYETLVALRKERDEANACFYQYRSLLNKAKELAMKKDTTRIEALSNCEVEKFMLQWSSNKAFRDDYKRRMLASLNLRQFSRDGRMRNHDESPIIVETPVATKLETSLPKMASKQEKEVVKLPSSDDTVAVTANITQGEELTKLAKADAERKFSNTEETGKARKDNQPHSPTKSKEIDPAKLKEIKREEELAKAKLAMERKKKLEEKAAAKAAARAQKEAEKKLKQKEKKAKKKAGTIEIEVPTVETEEETMTAELEEAHVNKSDKPVSEARKEQKVNVKYRSQPKVKNQLPRAILKRKKSHSYVYWAAPAAILALVLAVIAGYYSFGRI